MVSLALGGHAVTVTVLLLLPTPVRLVCLRSPTLLGYAFAELRGCLQVLSGLPTGALACCLRCSPRLPAGARSWWQSCLRARRCSCSACRGELPSALLRSACLFPGHSLQHAVWTISAPLPCCS